MRCQWHYSWFNANKIPNIHERAFLYVPPPPRLRLLQIATSYCHLLGDKSSTNQLVVNTEQLAIRLKAVIEFLDSMLYSSQFPEIRHWGEKRCLSCESTTHCFYIPHLLSQKKQKNKKRFIESLFRTLKPNGSFLVWNSFTVFFYFLKWSNLVLLCFEMKKKYFN